MDYLDVKKQFRHHVILMVGYVCVAVAITIGTLVLVQQAYGFGLSKKGTLIQSGLTFFSSQPHPATITLNGKLNKDRTNARISLPEGIYQVEIARPGYRSWRRSIEVDGGKVHHFDYPLLIPTTLKSKRIDTFSSAPGVSSQSPDRRWLMVQRGTDNTIFDFYDLKNPTKAPVPSALPSGVASNVTTSQSWLVTEWAGDNDHVLLQHNFDGKIEFILLDRTDPEQSLNLTNTVQGDFNNITLIDKKYDRYYLYNTTNGTLETASLSDPTAKPFLTKVLNYQSYKDDTVLYATASGAPKGKVLVKLKVGDQTYPIRSVNANTTYLLNLTGYSGDLYVAVGASSENKIFIYKDPVGQINSDQRTAVPSQVLHVVAPNYLSFSTSAQFIVAENGTQFGVYDIENEKGSSYTAAEPLDAPQQHASWMDGNRLTYISNGRLIFFDYDYKNLQVVVPAGSSYLPAYAPNYRFIYTLTAPDSAGQSALNQTALLTPADQ